MIQTFSTDRGRPEEGLVTNVAPMTYDVPSKRQRAPKQTESRQTGTPSSYSANSTSFVSSPLSAAWATCPGCGSATARARRTWRPQCSTACSAPSPNWKACSPGRKGKPKWPEHWSGVDKIKDRAAMAGPEYEEFYRAEYWFQSCYVHAGATGILNLDREAFEKYFAILHNMVQRLFLEATRIVAGVYPLFQMEPGLRQELEKAPTLGKVWAVMKLLEEGGTRPGDGGTP